MVCNMFCSPEFGATGDGFTDKLFVVLPAFALLPLGLVEGLLPACGLAGVFTVPFLLAIDSLDLVGPAVSTGFLVSACLPAFDLEVVLFFKKSSFSKSESGTFSR